MDQHDGPTALKAAIKRRFPSSRLLLTPLLVFVGLFAFEYCLESRYSHAVDASEQQLGTLEDTSVQEQREPLWSRLGFKTCRFPDFYDYDGPDYDLHQTNWIDSGWAHRQELKKKTYERQRVYPPTEAYYEMMLRKEQPRFGFSNLIIERNISFVHIGKAGGSSLGCNLAEPRRYVRKHCSRDDLKRPVPMSALSLSVSCYTHWNGHMNCYRDNDSFLVNIRHPLQRMASWFLYEHVRNHQINYLDRSYHCGDLILFSCYESFDDLITIGLQEPQPSSRQPLRMGPNLTATECSHWAWAAVQGGIPASYHNFFNYDWYTHHMYHGTSDKSPELFVLRSEHFEQDWRTIDKMLGGNGSFPSSLESKANEADKKPLLVTDRTASAAGIRNLCLALCEEIQTYKKLLTDAVNLNGADRETSLQELKDVCPEEFELAPRTCKGV